MLEKEFEILKIAEVFCIENNQSKISLIELYCLLQPRFVNYTISTEGFEILANFSQKNLPSLFPLFSMTLVQIQQSISKYKAKTNEGTNNE